MIGRPSYRVRRLLTIALSLLAAGGVIFQIRQQFRRPAPPAVVGLPGSGDSLSEQDDLDRDGVRDALPVRRLAGSAGGAEIVESIASAGGYAAWARHRTVGYRLEGIVFDDRGAVTGHSVETHRLKLDGPTRIAISPRAGDYRFGYGPSGAWVEHRRSNGRWDVVPESEAFPPRRRFELTWRPWWLFGLPFHLGAADLRLLTVADAEGDTLRRLDAVYPPAAGDSVNAVYRLGLDPETAQILEVTFPPDPAAPDFGRLTMRFSRFTETGGVFLPLARTLWSEPREGAPARPIFAVQLDSLEWDLPLNDESFRGAAGDSVR